MSIHRFTAASRRMPASACTTPSGRLRPLAWACLAACLTPGASTWAAGEDVRVEVTGSRLNAVQQQPTSQVIIATREELQRSGAATVREWLDTLPAHAGGINDIGGNASFAAGASGASLRNMGKQATLVLLNGRRLSPYPLADYNEVFTNIDTLPFEAIDRVEVLLSGGAAVYGSDAVAGVINIITRADYQGVQGRISHQRSTTSGLFGNSSAALTGGFKLPGSADGHVMANLAFYSRAKLTWREVLNEVRAQARELSPSMGSRSTYSWPGNVIGVGPVAGCTAENLGSNGLCLHDRYQRFEIIPAAERINLFATARLPLGAGREAFTELLLARNKTHYLSPFQPYGTGLGSTTWGNPLTNAAQDFTYRGLPPGHPLNPTGDEVEFRYRFVDGPSQTDADTTQYRLMTGVRSPWVVAGKKLEAEVAVGAMGGRTRLNTRGAFSLSGFHEVIGNDDPNQTDPLFFNRAYRIGQVNDTAVVDKLFPAFGFTGRARHLFVDAKLSGEVARTAYGAVNAVVGGDLRHEQQRITPSQGLQQGDIVGYGLAASDGSRWVSAAFAEVGVPIATGLELQGAARIDKFGSVAANLVPKLAMRYTPAPSWLVRATVEGGFRAPNLTETAPSTKFAFGSANDPQRCPQATALAKDLRAQADALPTSDPQRTLLAARADNITGAECGAAIASIVAPNAGLKPETSRNANLGLVFAPSKTTKVSVDLWSIERKNEIGLRNTAELLAAEATLALGTITRAVLGANDPSFSLAEQAKYGVKVGGLSAVTGRFENFSRTRNRGTDLAVRTEAPTPLGPLALSLDATYQNDIRFWSTERGGWGDNLAGRSGYPRWKITSGATLKWGAFEHGMQAITTSGTPLRGDYYDTAYTAQGCADSGYTPSQCRVAGYTRFDYSLAWRGIKGWVVSANVYNVFNTLAPIAVAAWLNGGGILPPTTEDAKGRMLRLSLEANW